MFVIVSGKPAGEVNHRAKFWTENINKAKECEAVLDAEVASGGGQHIGDFCNEWLYGPHIYDGKGLMDSETEEWK